MAAGQMVPFVSWDAGAGTLQERGPNVGGEAASRIMYAADDQTLHAGRIGAAPASLQ